MTRQGDVFVLTMLALLPFAGCLDAPDSGSTEPGGGTAAPMRLGGAFTEAATQADIQEAGTLARAEGGQMLIMESFPAQFQANGLDAAGCERLRAALQAKAYVAQVGECQPVTQSADPDASTSSSGAGNAASDAGAWRFGGTFTADHTDEDVRAVCEAGTGNGSCAIMKSYPPQYSFRFESGQACREARERVLAVPHVANVSPCAPEPEA